MKCLCGCGESIPASVIALAKSRGTTAKYASPLHRRRANNRNSRRKKATQK
jgi:hypothetical protein